MPESFVTVDESSQFFSRGFFVRPKLFTQPEIAEIRAQFTAALAQARNYSQTTLANDSQFVVSGQRVERIVWVCGVQPQLKKFAQDKRIVKVASSLLGSNEVVQLICQAHYKEPGDEVSFPWHQDSQNRGYGTAGWQDINGRGSYVQSLIAVDPTPIESGPLCFIPNTVASGHLALDQAENYARWIDESKAEPVILAPGDTVFFHPFAIHGSRPNQSQHSRQVFINGFAYPGANRRQYPGCGIGEAITLDPSSNPAASLRAR